jgi:hypothetical protein
MDSLSPTEKETKGVKSGDFGGHSLVSTYLPSSSLSPSQSLVENVLSFCLYREKRAL